ncbi:protease Do-like 7 isoform X2 [Cucumis melo var. makuwa]|uniref:Protease Do-like 7 isoform X2 n=1 Tax=Cucumis melo var. makuwa TaxID=1194695 RepID=A0A5D3BQZ1_CUCMM|nr:protease Do-like 7 isoform X2 [Cucumis melo var. makuwa]
MFWSSIQFRNDFKKTNKLNSVNGQSAAVTGGLVLVPGGPAHKLLEPGDVLVRMNGEVITQFLKMETLLDDTVKQTIDLQVERGGASFTVHLVAASLIIGLTAVGASLTFPLPSYPLLEFDMNAPLKLEQPWTFDESLVIVVAETCPFQREQKKSCSSLDWYLMDGAKLLPFAWVLNKLVQRSEFGNFNPSVFIFFILTEDYAGFGIFHLANSILVPNAENKFDLFCSFQLPSLTLNSDKKVDFVHWKAEEDDDLAFAGDLRRMVWKAVVVGDLREMVWKAIVVDL